jgi:TnpA family transposase
VRHPILLALAAQSAVDVLDEVVSLFDRAVSGREAAARQRLDEQLAERARLGEDRQALLDDILAVVLDPAISDARVGKLLRQGVGMPRMRAAWAAKFERLPKDHGHLGLMHESYNYLREFTPKVLEMVKFSTGGNDTMVDLIAAVEILRELNLVRGRKVPEGVPDSFVPKRFRGYLDAAVVSGDVTAYRHYWELCVLLALRDGLRSGDVYVPGSRRYADPAAMLFTPEKWNGRRLEYCQLVDVRQDGADELAIVSDQMDAALADFETMLADGTGPVRLNEAGELVIPPLTAEDIPAEVEVARESLMALVPRAPIASVVVEIDQRTGFTDFLIHASGKQSRPPELKRHLYAVLIAQACNFGLTAMAEATGISYDTLVHTAEWYFRDETLRQANAALVNYHHSLAHSKVYGGGTLSSSDGQRFPTKGKSTTARHLSRYFAEEGVSQYTHVSDQHSTFGTRVIPATDREATHVFDALFDNAIDLPITEHAVDTHGQTFINFALFALAGKQLSPRIRDLGGITLYRMLPAAEMRERYPRSAHLFTARANTDKVMAQWDDLLRLAGSMVLGHATASLMVGKLTAAARRQNALAAALREYGAIQRTLYALKYMTNEDYRRKITRQLNKGESLHAVRRNVHHAREGAMRKRFPDAQNDQAWCLTLLTNIIVCWMTEYLGLAVEHRRSEGLDIAPEILSMISPARTENINLLGEFPINVDAELAGLSVAGFRPLRSGLLGP